MSDRKLYAYCRYSRLVSFCVFSQVERYIVNLGTVHMKYGDN